jgi:hypothetical protein
MGNKFSKAVEILILIDIFVESNTAFYKFGQCETDRYKVTNYYLSKHLFKDLSLYLIYQFGDLLSPWLLLIFLIKLNKISKFFSMVHEILNIDIKVYNYLELTKLLTTILFTAHFFACVWLLEGRI